MLNRFDNYKKVDIFQRILAVIQVKSMFGLAPSLRVLPSLRQWDVDVEVGVGQMRKMR